MAAKHTFIALVVLLSSIQLASAGCAGEIFICRGDKDPCSNKQCPQGQVCRVNNCRGCFAQCEPPNMVHVMGLGQPNPGSNSPGSSSSNGKVTQEAGPSRGAACACPRNYSPVCGTGACVELPQAYKLQSPLPKCNPSSQVCIFITPRADQPLDITPAGTVTHTVPPLYAMLQCSMLETWL
jgi:hypothetical protein